MHLVTATATATAWLPLLLLPPWVRLLLPGGYLKVSLQVMLHSTNEGPLQRNQSRPGCSRPRPLNTLAIYSRLTVGSKLDVRLRANSRRQFPGTPAVNLCEHIRACVALSSPTENKCVLAPAPCQAQSEAFYIHYFLKPPKALSVGTHTTSA